MLRLKTEKKMLVEEEIAIRVGQCLAF